MKRLAAHALAALMLTVAMGLAADPSSTAAEGCQANGAELAAIGQEGQAEMTAGEVWGGMASSQEDDFAEEVEPGPGVVARHMELQMETLCGD